jgi:hypothetical protein
MTKGKRLIEALSRLVGGAPHVEGLPVIIVSVTAGLVMAAVRSSSGRSRRETSTCAP